MSFLASFQFVIARPAAGVTIPLDCFVVTLLAITGGWEQ
jgi:hypothetical protein